MPRTSRPDRRAPCLIGVATRTWHPDEVGEAGAPEPLVMWEELARAAAIDAGGRAPAALADIQRLDVVFNQGWQYDDPPARLAARLGCTPAIQRYSGLGGTVPQALAAEAAEDMAAGRLDLALVVGAEALATKRRLKKAGVRPQWSYPPAEKRPYPMDIPFHPAEVGNGIFEAYLTFALFDSARRAHRGTALEAHRLADGRILSPLSAVAAQNPDAWFPIARSPEEIAGVSPDNRLVAYPYTKLMTSIMDVDMAAALLLATSETADRLGVPAEQRVYLRGWAYAEDPYYVAERRELWRSPAMRVAGRAALNAAGVGIDDVAHMDLYSCFASSIGFAADALGLGPDAVSGDADHPPARPVTVTGGLPYHGGPGSNYMTHSIAAMVRRLRAEPGAVGLTSGVGMHMTKHGYGVWSTDPGSALVQPTDAEALAEQVAADLERVPITVAVDGDATVATYSVLHGRDGAPAWAALVLDLPDGTRGYARLEDPDDLAQAEVEELVGARVRVTPGEQGANRAVVTKAPGL